MRQIRLTSLLHLRILKHRKVTRWQSDKADDMGPGLKLEQAPSEVHVLRFFWQCAASRYKLSWLSILFSPASFITSGASGTNMDDYLDLLCLIYKSFHWGFSASPLSSNLFLSIFLLNYTWHQVASLCLSSSSLDSSGLIY